VKAPDGKTLNGIMTNPAGPVVLSLHQVAEDLAPFALFSSEGLDLYLLPGERFAPYADAVGVLRELTYRQQLSGSGRSHDLDSRDPHYDHFLLVERGSGALAGSARLQFVPQRGANAAQGPLPQGHQSYLEHVYPGLKATLASRGNHLEIGRVALAPRFQRLPHTLMCLFRGGLQVAVSSGYDSIHGLVSYNHFAYPEAVNSRFLSNLLRPPFLQQDPPPPAPRHPLEGIQPNHQPGSVATIQALEQQIRDELDPAFRLPVLLRQYINLMEARVRNLSLARDFNQITEILMAADLGRIPRRRLSHFIDFAHEPVYRRFSWYRGN
jgi:hypothetical protein